MAARPSRSPLAAARRRAGYSQEHLAELLGVSRTTVAGWERGSQGIHPRNLKNLANALEIDADQLIPLLSRGATPGDADRHPASTWGNPQQVGGFESADPPFLDLDDRAGFQMFTPRRVGRADVRVVAAVTSALAGADNTLGGGAISDHGRAQLQLGSTLLTGSTTNAVRRDLLEAVGNLAQVVGFAHLDEGKLPAADRYLRFALWCAEQSESWSLRACVLADLSRLSIESNSPDNALTMTDLALVRRDRLPPRSLVMLQVLHARYLASVDRVTEAQSALDAADTAFPGCEHDDDPPWLSYYDRAEHAGSVGRTLLVLAGASRRPTEAIARLTAAAETQDARHVRSRVFSQLRLATLLINVGNLDDGISIAHDALPEAASLRSQRIANELVALHQATRGVAIRPLDDLGRRIAAVLTTSPDDERLP